MDITIDWSKAPEWAKFAAMDEEGEWYWYEEEPYIELFESSWNNGRETKYAKIFSAVNWKDSLIRKPE